MHYYRLIVDGSGDFGRDRLRRCNAAMIPMTLNIGDESVSYVSGKDDEFLVKFYEAMKDGALPTTSMISAYDYENFFTPFLEEGEDLLYLCLDSGISGSYDQACLAAKTLKETYPDRRIHVVDTRSCTAGIALLLDIADENRNAGMSIEDNAAFLEKERDNIGHFFAVEDLKHLERGGRISAFSAALGSALNIKPILHIDLQGKLMPVGKVRGEKQMLKELVARTASHLDKEKGKYFIVHGNSEENAEKLGKMLKKATGFDPQGILPLCPVVGSHTGNGLLAIIFRGQR